MLFNSITFFIFLGIVLVSYFLVPRHWKKNLLLLASYVFYGFWDWRFCFLISFSTVLDFFVGQQIFNSKKNIHRKRWLILSLVGNLGVLAFFKYFNFFVASFTDLITAFGGQVSFVELQIILPVGISFYTFQTLSYTIDIYRKKIEPECSFTTFALFVAFFPQLVAGPIERARNLLPQLNQLHLPTQQQLKEGFIYITLGLTLKMIIGDNCGKVVDLVFAAPQGFSSTELLIAPVLFLFQVYGDFAGYSLVARGVAKLLGVELMVNFRQPLLSTNYTDFWRRWHISLYQWFREYLYFPLGGSRKGTLRTYLNVLIIMTLLGLWHGSSWTFVLWGVLNGIALIIDKVISDARRTTHDTRWSMKFLGIVSTVLIFSLTLIVFRTYELSKSIDYFQYLLAFSDFSVRIRVGWTAFMAIGLTYGIDIIYSRYDGDAAFLLKVEPITRYAILLAIWIVLLMLLFSVQPVTYYYFQF